MSKTEAVKNKEAETALERSKLQFMLAWREKMLEKYKEMLKSAEEENKILSAYLDYLLLASDRGDGTLVIPKEEIARRISGKRFAAEEREGSYYIKIIENEPK